MIDTEIQYLDKLEGELQHVFDSDVEARDHAQSALEQANQLKAKITQRRIELLRAAQKKES